MDFSNRTVWITGASSGIGAALARAFAAHGAATILSGRRRDALDALAAGLAGEALVLPFEATDEAALPAAADAAWGWRAGVDILVNNAGISQRSLAIETDFAVYRMLIETDLLAPIALTQAILPLMAARRSGHIVAISSVAGRLGPVLRTGYAAAKHGLIGYCDALRAEIETAYGIKVTAVLPGSVRTEVAANALQADGSRRGQSDANIEAGMDPAECARRILAAVAAGTRELVVAEGAEAFAATLRWQDPERLFDLLAAEGARLAAERDEGRPADPAPVNRTLPEG
ncbi:MAG TPA: SDR family NAD(P)-dependent oxidoreductase [Allosphingosinicella sp.]|nr:SDR family NAD(P)-dependent oxidoreductase [Allosphingosinicella sp.]